MTEDDVFSILPKVNMPKYDLATKQDDIPTDILETQKQVDASGKQVVVPTGKTVHKQSRTYYDVGNSMATPKNKISQNDMNQLLENAQHDDIPPAQPVGQQDAIQSNPQPMYNTMPYPQSNPQAQQPSTQLQQMKIKPVKSEKPPLNKRPMFYKVIITMIVVITLVIAFSILFAFVKHDSSKQQINQPVNQMFMPQPVPYDTQQIQPQVMQNVQTPMQQPVQQPVIPVQTPMQQPVSQPVQTTVIPVQTPVQQPLTGGNKKIRLRDAKGRFVKKT